MSKTDVLDALARLWLCNENDLARLKEGQKLSFNLDELHLLISLFLALRSVEEGIFLRS